MNAFKRDKGGRDKFLACLNSYLLSKATEMPRIWNNKAERCADHTKLACASSDNELY
jgi:hypothetical protein